MNTLLGGYLRIIASSTTIYIFIIVAIKIFGKKQLGQLGVVDLTFILLMSNAVQNAMVGSDTSLLGGLVAAASLFFLNYILKLLMYRYPKLSDFIQGETLLLIYEGKLMKDNIRRAKITEEELMEVIREHGASSTSDVNLAVLEIDGSISILSNDYTHKTVKKVENNRVLEKGPK